MYSVKLILDKRSNLKDNTFPIKSRIIINRKTYHLTTGYSVLEKDWDARNQKVKSSCKSVENISRLNNHLLSQKKKISDTLLKLEDEQQLDNMNIRQIKRFLSNGSTDTFILSYSQDIVGQLVLAGKTGNARVYNTMLRSVRRFLKEKDIPLQQITFSWLKQYEAWYLGKGNSVNGLSVHMRTLRAVVNRAIKEGLLYREHYPFEGYSISQESTRKRAISLEDLKAIISFVPRTIRQAKSKRYFLMSFYMMGASFVDLAHLKLENIVDGRINYKRRKTGRLHSILLTEPLEAIIHPLIQGKEENDYILGVLNSDDPKTQARQIRDELRRYNRALKEIGASCKLKMPLTSYVARHTYATVAKHKGVPTAIISEALGHSSEQVTQIYLDSFAQDRVDEYHQHIIS